MRRLGEWIVALLVIGVCIALALLPFGKAAPKTDPAVVAELNRLKVEVEDWKRRVDAIELAQWKTDQHVTAIQADLAVVKAQQIMILKVVPIQAIRDRAVQR